MKEKPIFWEEEHRVDAHDVDYEGSIRPSVLLRYIQDAAGHAHHCLGLPLKKLREENKAYILSKVAMRICALPRAYERLRAVTWITPVKGFSFVRYGRILRGEEIIAEMSSVWALTDITDPTNRKLLRGDAVELPFGTGEPLDLGFGARMKIPSALEMKQLGAYTVRYADCDENRHMNNTVYPDLFRGFAVPRKGMHVSEFEIAYRSEAPMGASLTVMGGEQGDEWYFRSLREDGEINAEVRMKFTDD